MTCLLFFPHKCSISFWLSLMCADDRFPEYGKVEFIFSFGPEKIHGKNHSVVSHGYVLNFPLYFFFCTFLVEVYYCTKTVCKRNIKKSSVVIFILWLIIFCQNKDIHIFCSVFSYFWSRYGPPGKRAERLGRLQHTRSPDTLGLLRKLQSELRGHCRRWEQQDYR